MLRGQAQAMALILQGCIWYHACLGTFFWFWRTEPLYWSWNMLLHLVYMVAAAYLSAFVGAAVELKGAYRIQWLARSGGEVHL
jgi:hypothetical protein